MGVVGKEQCKKTNFKTRDTLVNGREEKYVFHVRASKWQLLMLAKTNVATSEAPKYMNKNKKNMANVINKMNMANVILNFRG